LAQYHRGTALLMRRDGAPALQASIDVLRECLESRQLDAEQTADARYNLELAKESLWEWITRMPNESPPHSPDEPTPEAPIAPERRPMPASDPADRPRTPTESEAAASTAQPPADRPPATTERTAPGSGTLPVLLDADRPPPLSPEDGRAWLDRIALRLKRDRIRQAELSAGPERKQIRDW